MTKKAKAVEAATETVVAFKGFDKDMACHPSGGQRVQYAVGETVETKDDVVRCGAGGFHACEYPLDVFGYYPPNTSRYAIVEASGKIARGGKSDDSKIAASRLTVKAEIGLPGLIKAAIEYTIARAKPESDMSRATGDQGAASATGDQGAASATGDQGAASATGYQGAASATGYQGAASATGDRGAASATGYRGAAMASGRYGRVMGKDGNALFLVERDDEWKVVAVWSGIVGREGIKADTWYTLRGGKPVEV